MPAKSRLLVGSSSSSTSTRDSRMAASAARAASPPDSVATSCTKRPPSPTSQPDRGAHLGGPGLEVVAARGPGTGRAPPSRRRPSRARPTAPRCGGRARRTPRPPPCDGPGSRAASRRAGHRAPGGGSPTVSDAGARSTRPPSGSSRPPSTPQQGRLADAVRPDHADPVAPVDRQRHVVEHGLAPERSTHSQGPQHDRRPYAPPDRRPRSGFRSPELPAPVQAGPSDRTPSERWRPRPDRTRSPKVGADAEREAEPFGSDGRQGGQVSRRMVTGPSLTSSTAMSARKRPVATVAPRASSSADDQLDQRLGLLRAGGVDVGRSATLAGVGVERELADQQHLGRSTPAVGAARASDDGSCDPRRPRTPAGPRSCRPACGPRPRRRRG